MVERELHHFPMCMTCALTRRADVLKGLFRYDSIDRRLICNECLGFEHVVHINMLGRVLYVRDKVLVLCDECLRPKHWDTSCACSASDGGGSTACCVCSNGNTISSKEIIDVKQFRMQTVRFCYKHSLTCVLNSATVYDMRALEIELHSKSCKLSHTQRA